MSFADSVELEEEPESQLGKSGKQEIREMNV